MNPYKSAKFLLTNVVATEPGNSFAIMEKSAQEYPELPVNKKLALHTIFFF